MNIIRSEAVRQAGLMLHRLEQLRPGAAGRLQVDALSEIAAWDDVQVLRVPDTATPGGCSVAGGYVHSTDPPTLTIATSRSERRQQFTVLHELGHHLQKNDARLALAVRRQPGDSDAFEDAACDMFASLVLIPESILPARPAGRSPNAADVVDLFESSRASRAACCVRVAEQLGTPGVVAVLDSTGSVSFAAGHGDVFPPARGSHQAHTPLVAAALNDRNDARVDDTFLQYRTGKRSQPLYGDAAWAGDYLIIVAVLDRPGWKAFAPARTDFQRFVPASWTCEVCEEEFTPEVSCPTCETPRCDSAHCRCTLAAERQCQACFLVLHANRFTSPEAAVCVECAS